MTASSADRAPATFEIKSATLPLVSMLLKSSDLCSLAEELNTRFGDIPDFFDHDPLVLDLSPLKGKGEIDFGELLHLLRGYRVLPVAARGGSAAQMAAALAVGLAAAPDALVAMPPGAPASTAAAPAPPVLESMAALVIDKPLRSGQQVYARGRDLVVLSMV